ncbi:hypothetical protein L6452_00851 [Arctium lappa]|uniref:Uncharacterized protein n=1 Tax=Arctium lappa TaxID=4217 RepID=A0ACB9FFP5_ARCLA|nr:hypothetical protein L6452_00851 [Arctium lappa]
MNSINVKMEKANAILRFHRLQTITTLFRFIEMFVFLIVISRFSSQLPFAVKISADNFRGISVSFFSPRFVFVIGNVIVLILLFKSRAFENGDGDGKVDVYDEYIRRCEKSVVNNTSNISTTAMIPSKERKICRSQSENLMIVECKNNNQTHRKLRRSVTERKISKKVDRGGGETAAEDEMSSEEFRRTVEAFITRQQQSLRNEELFPVAYIGE